MGEIVDACIDTRRRIVMHGGFIIQEVRGGQWEWCHRSQPSVNGLCPDMYAAIDAVNAWHDTPSAGQVEGGR